MAERKVQFLSDLDVTAYHPKIMCRAEIFIKQFESTNNKQHSDNILIKEFFSIK